MSAVTELAAKPERITSAGRGRPGLIGAGFLALALCARPAVALDNDVVSLDCHFAVAKAYAAFLPENLTVSYEVWGNRAKVDDPIIARVVGKPVVADIGTSDRRQVRMSWNLPLKIAGKRLRHPGYKLTLLLPGYEAILSFDTMEGRSVVSSQAIGKCDVAKE
jgi:hypothetical protein